MLWLFGVINMVTAWWMFFFMDSPENGHLFVGSALFWAVVASTNKILDEIRKQKEGE